MARTDAMSILTSQETADKLAELDGQLIENIQKDALSTVLKNTQYSGDPTTGSVEINRFKNAEAAAYGTARAAGEGAKLMNSGKVVINLDQDKEIVEEIAWKDLKLFGIVGLADRRTANHSKRAAADLDRVFFAVAEAAATEVEITKDAIEEALEEVIVNLETTNNDWVDGVERADMAVTLNPTTYSKVRNYIDKIDGGAGKEAVEYFHGVRVYSNVRQTVDVLLQRVGSVAQPAMFQQYAAEKIGLSNDCAIELFYSYGTKAVTPDLIRKATLTAVTPVEPTEETTE